MIWSISSTLHEATEIDPRNARYINDNLANYLVPVNTDIQQLDVVRVPEQDDLVNLAGVISSLMSSSMRCLHFATPVLRRPVELQPSSDTQHVTDT
jgi:hypothetical protein